MHLVPDAQAVGPVQVWPPHCPYFVWVAAGAEEVEEEVGVELELLDGPELEGPVPPVLEKVEPIGPILMFE